MNKKNRILGVLSAAAVIMSLGGCGSNAMDGYQSFAPENGYSYPSGGYSDNYIDGDYNSDFDNEEYNLIKERGFLSAKSSPLSTFSADVDTASYANIRRMINNGEQVNPDAVRIEEMLNYFDYDYNMPEQGEAFGVTSEIMDCPWNKQTKLLSIGIKTEKIDFSESGASNLVFLLDVSGSMHSEDKLPLMVKAFTMLTENLTEKDRVSIVTYAGADEIVLKGADGSEKNKIISALNELSAGGSTAGSAGIKTAYDLAEKYFIENGNNRIILATDGDLNVGITSQSELKKLVEEKRESGIYLSVLGFGTGNIKDSNMETLADNGNGNYSYIDSVNEAKKVLVNEMGATFVTVAKDVKFQVDFNPLQVKGYRLIGYENRALANEDFADDTKDAGEIGAGHTVTVLYEIALADSEMNIPESSESKYQNSEPNADSDEWLTVNIRYKQPDSDESTLASCPVGKEQFTANPSEDILFESCVAEFGMLLRDSEYKGTSDYGYIIDTLKRLDCVKDDEYKSEFKDLVRKYNY